MEGSHKRVQRLEEEVDKVSEEHKEESKEPNLTELVEQTEPFKEPQEQTENHGAPTEQLEERKLLKEQNFTEPVEQTEAFKEPQEQMESHGAPAEHLGERKILKEPQEQTQPMEQTQPIEHQKPEKEDNQPIEKEKTQDLIGVPPQQTEHCKEEERIEEEEDRTGETVPTRDPAKVQSIEDVVQHIAHRASHHEVATQDQREEQDCQSNNQSQSLEEQSHNENRLRQEQEQGNKDRVETQKGEEKQVAESESVFVKGENQTEIEKDTDTNTEEHIKAVIDPSMEPVMQMGIKAEEKREVENPQQIKMEVHAEISMKSKNRILTETDLRSGIDKEVEAETAEDSDPAKEAENQKETNTVADTDQWFWVETVEIRDMDSKGLTDTKIEAGENNTLTETDIKGEDSSGTQKAETNIDLQREILSLKETHREAEKESLDERIEEKKETDFVVDTATCIETDSEILPADSKTESDDALPESTSETELSKPREPSEEIVIYTQKEVGKDISTGSLTQADETVVETKAETQMHQETTDSITPRENSQTSTEPANQTSAAEHDGKPRSLPKVSSGQPAAEQPRGLVTISPVEDKQKMEKSKETVAEAEVVFVSSPNQIVLSNVPQPTHKDESCTIESQCNASNPCLQNKEDSHLLAELGCSGLILSAGPRVSTTSGDFRVRKSSSSRGSRLARRLSEDLFTAPLQTTQSQSIPSHPDQSKHTLSQSNKAPTHSRDQIHLNSAHSGAAIHQPIQEGTESEPCKQVTSGTEGTVAQQQQIPVDTPKRFGLFRRLRGEQSKKTKEKGEPKKIQVPKILIQDFSDGVGKGRTLEEEEEEEEKLSSRERRKRWREQERREKEEETLRKKREKELEKERERERRKPKSRGKGFQVQKDSGSGNVTPCGNISSQKPNSKRHSVPYVESYF